MIETTQKPSNGETSMNDETQQCQPSANQKSDDVLTEGALYVFKDGEFIEIPRDPEDTLKKIRLMDEAVDGATKIQKQMRRALGGYKPDLSMVCSALIIAKAAEDDAPQAVAQLFAELTAKMGLVTD